MQLNVLNDLAEAMKGLDGKKMHRSYGFGCGVGMKDGNYYNCDWRPLRPESNQRFALSGSVWPERLWTRQGWQPKSAHKRGVTDSDRTGVAGGKAVFGFSLATYFVTLKPHTGLLARGKGPEQGKVGIRRYCRPYPPSVGACFFPLGKVVVTILVIHYQHGCMCWPGNPVLPTQATWTPMSAQEALQIHVMCLLACQHVVYTWTRCSLFPRLSVLKFPIFEFTSPKKCLQISHW